MKLFTLALALPCCAHCCPAQSADDWLQQGHDAYSKGDNSGAIHDFTEAIRLKPDSAEAFNARGAAYGTLGDYDHALNDFSDSIRLNPGLSETFFNRGMVYARKRDLDRALADLNEAIRLKPDYAEAVYARGAAYSAQGDTERALQDFKRAAELDPSIVSRVQALLRARQGKTAPCAPPGHAPHPPGVVPETGYVSEHRYSNAFFGFLLVWPEEARLSFQAQMKEIADIVTLIPARHLLLVTGYDAVVIIVADECPGASLEDAKGALPGGGYGAKSVTIAGRQFWKSDEVGTLRYSAPLDDYILLINVGSSDSKLLRRFARSVESMTFIAPGKAQELAGPDSWPPLTPPPGWDSGVVTGNLYSQPMLHFTYEFPAGWRVADQASAARMVEDGQAAAQHWDDGYRKMRADDGCPRTLLSLTKFPETPPEHKFDSNPRIFLVAFHPTLCIIGLFPDRAWLDDPARTVQIAEAAATSFQGAPFMANDNRKISAYSVNGRSMLEISGTVKLGGASPGENAPSELHTSFILSRLQYEWVGWGFVTDSAEELNRLKKFKFKFNPPLPGLPDNSN